MPSTAAELAGTTPPGTPRPLDQAWIHEILPKAAAVENRRAWIRAAANSNQVFRQVSLTVSGARCWREFRKDLDGIGSKPARVPSDLAPRSVKTTMTGISWMWRSHYIWWAGARPDRTHAATIASMNRRIWSVWGLCAAAVILASVSTKCGDCWRLSTSPTGTAAKWTLSQPSTSPRFNGKSPIFSASRMNLGLPHDWGSSSHSRFGPRVDLKDLSEAGFAVEDSAADLEQEVGTAAGPSHLLGFVALPRTRCR